MIGLDTVSPDDETSAKQETNMKQYKPDELYKSLDITAPRKSHIMLGIAECIIFILFILILCFLPLLFPESGPIISDYFTK